MFIYLRIKQINIKYKMNLVLITSVVCTPNIPLSYINTRSCYTHDERFEQTKKTIKTIKEKIPNIKPGPESRQL